jgi:hypothetical protein
MTDYSHQQQNKKIYNIYRSLKKECQHKLLKFIHHKTNKLFDKFLKKCFIHLIDALIFLKLQSNNMNNKTGKKLKEKKTMVRSGEEILVDIDNTLDHLIENADVIKKISFSTLYTNEVEALQKTQESLLARLVHMNDLLKGHKRAEEGEESFDSIEQKIVRFGKLNAQIISHAAAKIKRLKKSRQPRIRSHSKKVKSS